jgi:hypothetical protein
MGDHWAPYTKEGFTNPTITNLFTSMLQVPVLDTKTKRTRGTRVNVISSNGSCVPSSSTSEITNEFSLRSSNTEKISFLKSLLHEQKKSVDSLMESSKKINPISQKIAALDTAYEAAFESDVAAGIPNISGTLQGFTIVFFLLSFMALAIITTVIVNQTTSSTSVSIGTFGIFVAGMMITLVLLNRFG